MGGKGMDALRWLLIVIALGMVGWGLSECGVIRLPQAPWSPTPETLQLQDDEIECVMYNVLVDTKGSKRRTLEDEARVIKTIFNYSRVFKKRVCDILYGMDALVVPGTVRKGVPNRQDWYMWSEFSTQFRRKRAIREHIKELLKNPDPTWVATNYIRPGRKRTAGNQTDDEIKALNKTFDPIPKAKVKDEKGHEVDDPAEEFQFFKPKR
ncbi:MAG: hypothetical protein WA021_02860 [Minisyncoccia bacterium]